MTTPTPAPTCRWCGGEPQGETYGLHRDGTWLCREQCVHEEESDHGAQAVYSHMHPGDKERGWSLVWNCPRCGARREALGSRKGVMSMLQRPDQHNVSCSSCTRLLQDTRNAPAGQRGSGLRY